MSPNREAAEVAVLADGVAAFGGRLIELALVDEVHVVAGAHTAADGNVGHRHLGVAKQRVGGGQLPAGAELQIRHPGEQEHQRVEVGRAGIVARAEVADVSLAGEEVLQVVVHHRHARRRHIALRQRVVDHVAVLVGRPLVRERRDVQLLERELRPPFERLARLLRLAPPVALLAPVPSVHHLGSFSHVVCLCFFFRAAMLASPAKFTLITQSCQCYCVRFTFYEYNSSHSRATLTLFFVTFPRFQVLFTL